MAKKKRSSLTKSDQKGGKDIKSDGQFSKWLIRFLNANFVPILCLAALLLVVLSYHTSTLNVNHSTSPPASSSSSSSSGGGSGYNSNMPAYANPAAAGRDMSAGSTDEEYMGTMRKGKNGKWMNPHDIENLEKYKDSSGNMMEREGWQEATRMGMEAATNGDQNEALGFFKIAMEMHPTTVSAMNYGVALMRANKLDEALQTFKKSEELDPQKTNKELPANMRAIRQHLDYRAGRRTQEEIHHENQRVNVGQIVPDPNEKYV
ncbi:hypothetical protein TrST_g1983 [Triparma strigata]|uniref:Uncharacterized protein n=1 Tax=Triparma strigata TaxID=1606541 RepID=A0A9W7ANZ6_9STRA|nr:hypothetical protein TrST_g1983 [Triparma strigata]